VKQSEYFNEILRTILTYLVSFQSEISMHFKQFVIFLLAFTLSHLVDPVMSDYQ